MLTPTGAVDNDATLEIYAEMAVLHAAAGAHVVGPSGMMDGQVGAIRCGAGRGRAHRRGDLGLRARSTRRRSTARSARRSPRRCVGDRKTYQQDPANVREALREVALDLAEGADIVMVKPALAYLDIIRAVRDASTCRSRRTTSPASTRWSRPPPPTAGSTGRGDRRDADLHPSSRVPT